MPGPGGPANDLILQLMGAAKSRGGFGSSSTLRNRMARIQAGGDIAPGPLPRPENTVAPGPGSTDDAQLVRRLREQGYTDEDIEEVLVQQGRLPQDNLTERISENAQNITRLPPKISQDPWFDDLMTQAETAGGKQPKGAPPGEYFVWVTNKSGKRIRLSGPFTDAREAQKEMDRLAKSSPKVSLSIGTVDTE